MITTFGVGELSASNAIARACAESVPVVHIVGTPALRARQGHVTLHHNLPDNDFGHNAGQLDDALAAAALDTGDLVLIEAVLPVEDVPPLLWDLTRRLAG